MSDSILPIAASGASVSLRGLRKSFGDFVAVDDFSLEVELGSFTTLLGPSGCGKTTLLRMIAGFIVPDAGSILVAGRDMGNLPPERREVGMVFQDYALFPHMSVRENLAYGLKARGAAASERSGRIARIEAALGLESLAHRYSHELSGGQQQRVALGRALALDPRVLLMDEPLSNLDAKLRVRVREELKEIQARLGVTTIYVTHDQEEALALSDSVAVMSSGSLMQSGPSATIYRCPSCRFVADFVGAANFLPATCLSSGPGAAIVETSLGRIGARTGARIAPAGTELSPGQKGLVMVRPEWIELSSPGQAPSGGILAPTILRSADYLGSRVRYTLDLEREAGSWIVDESLGFDYSERRVGERLIARIGEGRPWWIGS